MSSATTNEIVLERLISFYEEFQYNKRVAILDVGLNLIYISSSLLEILQIGKSKQEMIGFNISQIMQIVERPPQITQGALQTLEKVLKHDCIIENIGINLKRNLNNIMLHFKLSPLHNRKTGKIVAIECEVSNLRFPLLLSSPNKLFKTQNRPLQKNNDDFLTNRQHEVLFLQFHCKSAKEIAQKLSYIYNKTMSLHTIGKINQQLYKKFGVYNLDALLEVAYVRGYNRKIPISLLSDHTIDIQEL